MDKESIYELYGVDKETYDKSKDVYPTLEIGKLNEDDTVIVICDEDKPHLQEHKKTLNLTDEEKAMIKKTKEPIMIKTPIIRVLFRSVIKAEDNNGEKLIVPMKDAKNTLWLSSKTLRMGFMSIAERTENKLSGIHLSILKGTAEFKEGKNTCYTVTDVTPSEAD